MDTTAKANYQLVSVVVPSYLAERTLIRALNSVVNEPGLLEVVVAVNGKDKSMDFLRDFQRTHPDLKMVILAPESHILKAGENWTRACTAASGEYIKLLCADDTVTHSTLLNQIRTLQNNPQIAFVTGKRIVTDIDGNVIRRRHGAIFSSKPLGYKASLFLCCIFGTNVFGEPSAVTFRSDILKKNLPWKDDQTYVIDLAMYLQILKNSPGMKSVALPLEVSTFEISKTSWSYSVLNSQLDAIRGLLFEHLRKFERRPLLLHQIVRLTTKFAFILRNRQFVKLEK